MESCRTDIQNAHMSKSSIARRKVSRGSSATLKAVPSRDLALASRSLEFFVDEEAEV